MQKNTLITTTAVSAAGEITLSTGLQANTRGRALRGEPVGQGPESAIEDLFPLGPGCPHTFPTISAP
ncbi:hypothetical protein [Luteipulveratus mongoliensis]|uniref:Uncharacterized protein n=1 Tax=Luteipulveratus mongoliensis TaxID=571913 RepID=A0A0K1JEE8_9MICO|nr:hypothetical protein [Luteipulveratus mongoliensis]AKU14965.1 hypothetical protein VV02_02260 [Luteipulveratus mongoliensis]